MSDQIPQVRLISPKPSQCFQLAKVLRAEKDEDIIGFGQTSAKNYGRDWLDLDDKDTTELQMILVRQENERVAKKFLINKVAKRRVDFAGEPFLCIFFS